MIPGMDTVNYKKFNTYKLEKSDSWSINIDAIQQGSNKKIPIVDG
jgi:hypothetical protein